MTLLLAGCATTTTPPTPSTTDPIQEALYFYRMTDWSTNSVFGQLGLEGNNATVSQTGAYRVFAHSWKSKALILGTGTPIPIEQMRMQFAGICENLKGQMIGGWCVDKKKGDTPLFWYGATVSVVQTDTGDVHNYSMYVLTPPQGRSADDPTWLAFAKSQGFMNATDRRLENQKLLKDSVGQQVCRTVAQGPAPLQRTQDKGYIEGVANRRLKIRIFEKGASVWTNAKNLDHRDVNNETIWSQPNQWYTCNE